MKRFLATLFFTLLLCLSLFAQATASTYDYMNMDWWKRFDDDNLLSLMQTVYDNNYDLKNTSLKIKENEQIVKMQFAQELPFANFSGDIYRNLRAPRQQFGSLKIPNYSQNNYNLPITVGYEIDIWGKNRLKTKSKKQQLEIIKQAERATYISLTSNFATDYFNLIKADKMNELQTELVKVQEDVLNKVTEKYRIGLCSINDVLEQEKLLNLFKEENNIHTKTKEVLINSMRVYLSEADGDIARSNYEEVKVLNNIPTEYSTDVITNRPDYLQEEANLKRIGFDVRVAKKEFLPTFTIFGQFGLNAYRLSSLFNSPSQFLNAGILPNWDLFSGGQKKANLKLKKFQYEQALNEYQKTYLEGIKEMNSSLVEYKTAEKNYQEALKKINTERKIYNLAKDKTKIGSASNLDELLAKEMYLIAEKEIVSNKIDTIISTIGLYKASGGVDLYKLNEKL